MKSYDPDRRQADARRVDEQTYDGLRTARRAAQKLKKAKRKENKRREREEKDDWR